MKRFLLTALVAMVASFSASVWAQTPVVVTNNAAKAVPVKEIHNLLHAGTFFSVGPGADQILTVPAGAVLTDAHVTFSIPESIPNAASLFIRDGAGNVLVYKLVNNTTFDASIDLTSGIPSTGPGILVDLSCYNISGNLCQGALMWSGYKP